MMGWGSTWEKLIGNERSSITTGKKNPGRQLGRGEEEFLTRAEHGLERKGEMWQLLKRAGGEKYVLRLLADLLCYL